MLPKVLTTAEATVFDVLGMEHAVFVSDAESSGTLMFGELRVPPGTGIPPHIHAREDEVFHVFAGRLTFTAGDREVVAGRARPSSVRAMYPTLCATTAISQRGCC